MVLLRGSVLVSSCLLLVFSGASNAQFREPPQVIGSRGPITAAPGDDVTLPCHLEPKYNVEAWTVEWSKPDLKPDPLDRLSRVEYVHLYRDRREVPDMKIRSYLRRTELFTDDLKEGNISLKIKNVTLADQGRYRCFLPKLDSRVKASIVQLVVVPQSEDTTTETHPRNLPTPHGNDDETDVAGGRLHLSALIPLAVCILLILVGGVRACSQKQKHQKQNPEYDVGPTSPLTV